MPHDLPVRRPTQSDELLADLANTGAALLGAVTGQAQLLELVGALGAAVVPHRDSEPDGVTLIEDRDKHDAAFAGFTRLPLIPHTDRSGVADPPNLLVTACGREPTTAGETILVDGRAVYWDLAQHAPDALRALSTPRSALFGGADGYLGSVFESAERGTIAIRFRHDPLVRFGPRAAPHIPDMMAAIERHAIRVPVRVGVGYILDNRRWLHGRLGYEGPRLMYRITATARQGTIASGFSPDDKCAAASAGPRS